MPFLLPETFCDLECTEIYLSCVDLLLHTQTELTGLFRPLSGFQMDGRRGEEPGRRLS